MILLLAISPVLGAADASRFVIIQPGYPGSMEEAAGFLESLAAHVGKKAGLSGVQGAYYNLGKPALEVLTSDSGRDIAFGLVSAGFYLEHRARLGMKALLESKPPDNFVVVARSGDLKSAADLKGQAVAGGPLHEARYLERMVFAPGAKPGGEKPGQATAGIDVGSWTAEPTLLASRALRDLARGKKHRAVVLTGRDYRAFSQLEALKTLEKIAASDYYPAAFLVVFGQPGKEKLSEESLRRVEEAFLGLSRDPDGKGILEKMGAEGFAAIRAEWLREMEGRYDARSEEKR